MACMKRATRNPEAGRPECHIKSLMCYFSPQMPSKPPQRARPATDLAAALLQVKGAGALTTAAYRSAMGAFLSSGQAVTVEGFAAYIHQLRRTRSAATVNQALAAGRKAFLQAAERLGMQAKEISLISANAKALEVSSVPLLTAGGT